MNSGYFIWLKNTFRWGYRLSIKQLFRFIFYSALAYCLLTGVLLVAFQIIARTPLIDYLTVDDVMNTVTWGGRTIQALVGIPVALNAIKTFIWLFTTAPHGLNGYTSYYTDTTHHPGTNHGSNDSAFTSSHTSHHGSEGDSCHSDSGSGGDSDSGCSD